MKQGFWLLFLAGRGTCQHPLKGSSTEWEQIDRKTYVGKNQPQKGRSRERIMVAKSRARVMPERVGRVAQVVKYIEDIAMDYIALYNQHPKGIR